ncbi:NUDIX hydrolase [Clostridium sp. A1-XYC3]|uniref:NUDIX hydrolase n=1 Tax=Clostridium tanneri TaxID=3037988 RepID=A0ABU4JYI6_9CLOT|nr:NUDIX hydrolase [Clostridium sp. A1-XYC3]MDW8803172.1 NUDIX hydrolase [Clostridium sp. A1-XYC3]
MSWIQSIKEYCPYNEQEEKDKEIMLKCINIFNDILTRNNEIVHITSSAFIVNREKDKVLMVHHNIYNSWSWTGGHADGEEDLLLVAVKEAKEETGIKNVYPVTKDIFSLDILPVIGHIKKGKYVSPHLHLSIAYLIEADESELLIIKEDENSDVKWIPMNKINMYSNEPHMHKVYNKIVSKIRG